MLTALSTQGLQKSNGESAKMPDLLGFDFRNFQFCHKYFSKRIADDQIGQK